MMFENYPKERIALPEKFQKIYSEHYKKNREGGTTASSLSQKMEVWMHKKIASDILNDSNKSTLEIGAGTLNQLKYEQSKPYDIIEPSKELYINSPSLNQINKIFNDIDDLPNDSKYDRITSVATFEHIIDLPKVVARTCNLLNNQGTLRVAIPNEGSFWWKTGWKLTTGIEFKIKYNLDYEILMKHEHVNTAKEIEEILNYFYENVSCSAFGLNKKISLYKFFECKNPNIFAAKKYLDQK